MHQTSIDKMALLVQLAKHRFAGLSQNSIQVIEIGGISHNNPYRKIFQAIEKCNYSTMNVQVGCDAEIIPKQAYSWPEIGDESYDVVISGQVFEHVEFYWATLLEIRRILKKGGLLCIIAPSHWPELRAPLDCQRFYADGLLAMMKFIGLSTIYSYAEHEHLVGRAQCDAIIVAEKPMTSELHDNYYTEAHKAIFKLLPLTTTKEVSRAQPTFQSSINSQWQKKAKPGNAVSGLFSGAYSFHTQTEKEPWWMVDLEKVYDLDTIKIFNRQDAAADRAIAMDILLSVDMFEWRTLYSNNVHFGGILDGKPLVIKVDSAAARYVRLQLRTKTCFHLDQVQVFANI